MNIYIFINIINLPVSSIQINLLRLINNKKLTLIGVFKYYNDSKILMLILIINILTYVLFYFIYLSRKPKFKPH